MDTHTGRLVYYVSNRPETYEFWGEVGHDVARDVAALVAERAGRRFPNIEFRIDADWHMHPPGLELVAAYIDEHLQAWIEEAATRARAA
mgnify:CR=1 FL=1